MLRILIVLQNCPKMETPNPKFGRLETVFDKKSLHQAKIEAVVMDNCVLTSIVVVIEVVEVPGSNLFTLFVARIADCHFFSSTPAPLGKSCTSTGGGPTNCTAVNSISYNALNDPHLYDYYIRKFIAMDPLLPAPVHTPCLEISYSPIDKLA